MLRRWLFRFAFVPACALIGLEACDKSRPDPAASDAATTSAEVDGGAGDGGVVSAKDGGANKRLILKLAAASFVASVSDSPEWPESDAGAKRLGYLRNGAVVSAYDPPIKNEDCKDGWYELVESGGYICGKVATIDLTNPRVKLAPKQPDRDAGMPYRYGVNVADGTPLYRRVLGAEDRRKFESSHGSSSSSSSSTAQKPAEGETATPPIGEEKSQPQQPPNAGENAANSGANKDEEPPLAATEEEPPPPRRHLSKREREREAREARERERNKDPFKGIPDGGARPHLKELKGHGVLVRRMARGFTVALDRDFKAAQARWWRTTFGFAVPYDRIVIQGGVTKYQGNWFTGDNATAELLPFPHLADVDAGAEVATGSSVDAGVSTVGMVAFVTGNGAHRIEVTDDGKGGQKAGWGAELPRRSAVLLTGREATLNGVTYQQTVGGFYVQLAGLKIAHPQIPADVGETEKWIDVDLTRQQLVAFEGRRPVFATLISSGRRNPQDKEHDFPTPTGSYRIREKHITTTMDGDVASDGPYSIEDVPWVMYFQGSYALHGAFWHDMFGNMRSHGCVNLSPEDARTLFHWAEPALPTGWHGVFSKDESSGSRVIVHEDPPPKRHRAAAVTPPPAPSP